MVNQPVAQNNEEFQVQADGQEWLLSWHPPPTPPAGKPHGAAGICVTQSSEIVLISANGRDWDVPAGRTEEGETWEQTLRREMLEEACATVVAAKLLGFARARCVQGHEAGLIVVRSFWRAEVSLAPWQPLFEITHRCVVRSEQALFYLPAVFLPIFRRAFREAGII